MLACGIPKVEGSTTEALVNAYILSLEALEACNARLAKLRAWASADEGEVKHAGN